MEGGVCTACGGALPAAATFCPRCGMAIAPATPLPAVAPFRAPPRGGLPPGGVLAREDDRAMRALQIAASVGLAGTILGLLDYSFWGQMTGRYFVAGTRGITLSIMPSTVWAIVALGAIGVAISLVQVWWFRNSLLAVAPVDGALRSPAGLALVALAGYLLFLVTLVYGGYVATRIIDACGTTHTVTRSCVDVGQLVGLAGLALLSAVLLIVGIIGIAIGLWRFGSRYRSDLFKVGGILWLFPYLNLAGLVLLLGADRVRRRIQTQLAAALPPRP